MKIVSDYVPTEKQNEFHAATERYLLYGGAVGGGKRLALDTPIATPTGWTTMGALQVGDEVFNEVGLACTVTYCSPATFSELSYEVSFSDDSVIVADAEHLWFTATDKERSALYRRNNEFREARRAKRPSRGTGKKPWLSLLNSQREYDYPDPPNGGIRTTQEIKNTLHDGRQINHSIQVAHALLLPTVELPLDPYLLGLWLGDGATRSGVFSTADTVLLDAFTSVGFAVRHIDRYDYYVSGMVTELRKMGVFGDKHIPTTYLRASEPQRLSLLQGLMDTDGCVTHHGHCEITLCNRRLIDDVLELIISLGIKATVRTGRATIGDKDCGEKYRIKFLANKCVFRLERKSSKQKLADFRGTHTRRYITDVRLCDSVFMRCIAVDSPSHLYLAGKSLIPTHNTKALCAQALYDSVTVPGNIGYMARQQGDDFKRTVLPELLAIIPPELIAEHHKTDRFIRFHALHKDYPGSLIYYGGLQEDRSGGTAMESPVKSMNLGWAAVDQAEEISELSFVWLDTRLRLKRPGIQYHIYLTANPAPCWLRERFVLDKRPNHRFIKALPADNPHLPAGYVENLRRNLPHDLAEQLLAGDWDIDNIKNYLFPWSKLKASIDREVDMTGIKICGIDCAREGGDKTVYMLRQGGELLKVVWWDHALTTFSAAKIARLLREDNPFIINVDAIGVGAGITDPLIDEGFNVRAVNTSVPALENDVYLNKRAEYYNKLWFLFRDEKISIPEQYSDDITKDLQAIRYEFDKGRLRIEDKKSMKKRIGRSPDFADALVLAFLDGVGESVGEHLKTNKILVKCFC